MQPGMHKLKMTVFHEMLDIAGRVFVVVRDSERVVIGNRGFTEEERKNGIVLVFNRSMNFSWDDTGIITTLVFGTSPQKCFIPSDDITAIYSPELNAQFIAAPQASDGEPEKHKTEGNHEKKGEKVVRVDFSRKKHHRTKTP
jgi:hypothetical protein